MIAHLQGVLETKHTEHIIIDIQGIGYLVSIPLSTFYQLPEPGERVKLFIYTYLREDCLQLFGFMTMEEKKTFELLIKVSKVGPKLALNVLSHISTEELQVALLSSDIHRLNSIPGIGEKTARRLVLELKDKLPRADDDKHPSMVQRAAHSFSPQGNTSMREDAVSALIGLGYNRLLAERAVNQIMQRQIPSELSIEELIKKALYQLAT